ncbi:hypothetical protein Hanom_Chr07g00635851 [Helianthus anomalus]
MGGNFHSSNHDVPCQFTYHTPLFPRNRRGGVTQTIFLKSKLSFWSLRFGHVCHFSPNLKAFVSGSLWVSLLLPFWSKDNSGHIYQIKSCYFVLFLRGKIVISFLFYLKILLKQ